MSERNSYISNVHTYTDSYEYVSMEGIQMRWNMWKIYVWNEYQKAYFYMLTFEQNQTNGKKSYVKTERRIEEGAEVTFKGVSFLLNKLYFSIFIFICTYISACAHNKSKWHIKKEFSTNSTPTASRNTLIYPFM